MLFAKIGIQQIMYAYEMGGWKIAKSLLCFVDGTSRFWEIFTMFIPQEIICGSRLPP